MEEKVNAHLKTLIKRYPALEICGNDILNAYKLLEECYIGGGKLLIAGNGGSCADAQHIVGELMKGFKLARKCPEKFRENLIAADPVRGAVLAEKLQGGLSAIALTEHQGVNTAFMNDVEGGGTLTFAQQVYGYGKSGDVFLGISTSGNSKNVLNAAVVARALGLKIIALTGESGGELAKKADVAIKVPVKETYMVQELHLPVYHCLCLMLEQRFFG